jgi:hypothetical protein
MKYLFENLEVATQARDIINTNMGYTPPANNFDNPRVINNPEHIDFEKAFIAEVEGDEYHHQLWMTGVDGVIPYSIVEYDQNWFLPEEI